MYSEGYVGLLTFVSRDLNFRSFFVKFRPFSCKCTKFNKLCVRLTCISSVFVYETFELVWIFVVYGWKTDSPTVVRGHIVSVDIWWHPFGGPRWRRSKFNEMLQTDSFSPRSSFSPWKGDLGGDHSARISVGATVGSLPLRQSLRRREREGTPTLLLR